MLWPPVIHIFIFLAGFSGCHKPGGRGLEAFMAYLYPIPLRYRAGAPAASANGEGRC